MIYSVSGKLALKSEHFVVIEVHGVGFKISVGSRVQRALPAVGLETKLFSHLQPREDSMELYGFSSEAELRFFELLISVTGVGPRSALAIMDVADLKQLSAAIKENRPDLLTRASGIGRKTAERIILELRGKVDAAASGEIVSAMESDVDLIETLVGLGYRREEAKAALGRVDVKIEGVEERLKAALKILGRK